jgi:hypothetical protein
MVVIFALIAILVMACACPVTNLFNSLLGKTQPEDLMELVPDDIMEALPETDELLEAIPDEAGELLEALPDNAEEMLEDMPFLEEDSDLGDMLSDEVPENVPLIENRNDDLLAMFGAVSYTTPMPLLEAYDFYRTEMGKLGWTINESMSSMDGEQKNATLGFSNDTQECVISFYVQESDTGIALFVTDK